MEEEEENVEQEEITDAEVEKDDDDDDSADCLLSSPIAKKQKLLSPSPIKESESCTICFEPWTNSGDHRVSVLNCGHLYGYNCIKKWVEKEQRCPQCNGKAHKKHIKPIYTQSLRVLDTAELDRALEALDEERRLRRKAEVDMATEKLKRELAEAEVARLKNEMREKEIETIKLELEREFEKKRGRESEKLTHVKFDCNACNVINVPGSSKYNCRVMRHAQYQNSLFVNSQLNDTSFGMAKLYIDRPMGHHEFIACHKDEIRDLAFNPIRNDGLLLSASKDKTVALSSILTNVKVQSFTCSTGVWCCTWDQTNASQFYAGLQNGRVLIFDIRQPRQEMATISPPTNTFAPIIGIQFMEPRPEKNFALPAILVAQLTDVYYCELIDNNFAVHPMPIKGPIAALSQEASSKQTMITLRPQKQKLYSQHLICEITMPPVGKASCNVKQCLIGGSLHKDLSKTAIFDPRNNGQLLACATNESTESLMLWDVETAAVTQHLPVKAVDVSLINNGNQHLLAALTKTQVHLYTSIGN